MISPTSSALMTIGIVGATNVLDDKKKITARFVVGSGIYLLFLAALNESNADLAAKIALLVLVGAIFVNGVSLFTTLGIK